MTADPALNRPVLCISRVRLCILLLPSNDEDMPSGVRRRHPAAAALLRDNLFIILLIPLVAVSAVRSVCVRTVITVAPDAAHYEEYHLFISSTSISYHVDHYFESVQRDGL